MPGEPVATAGASTPATLPFGSWIDRLASGRVVIALVGLAIAVRALVWHRTAALMNDGPVFLALAERYAAGEWREALLHPFHPLYPLAIAAAGPFTPDAETAAVTVSILSGGAAVAFLHDFLSRAFDRRVALVGALLLVVHPYAVPFSADVQSEGLYIALFLGAVAWTWRMLESGRAAPAALAGVLAGLAYLTRPEGAGVALVGGGLLLGQGVLRHRSVREVLACGAALGLGVLLIAGPYVGLVHSLSGELRLTGKKSTVNIVTLKERERAPAPPAPGAYRFEPGRGPGPGFAREPAPPPSRRSAFAEAVADVTESARHAFRLDHFLIAALGLWAVGGPPGLRGWLLGGLLGLYAFVLLGLHLTSGYVSMRHTLPPLLPLLGYVALGVPALGRVALALPALLGRAGPPPRRTAFAVGLAILVTASTAMAVRPQRVERAAAREAALWLAEQGEIERVASSKQRDAYYAQADHVPLPQPRGDWIGRLGRRGVRWVIFDERTRKRYRGLEEEARDSRIRLAHRAEAKGYEAWVVEIVDVN